MGREPDLAALRALVLVAREGSISAASARLGVSQQAVSLRIRGLETDLGVRLLARTTRAAVLEFAHADFVRTARSKGMSETRVVKWHVMRNALVIVLTAIGLQFGSLMGQAVVVEKLFSWPGLGSLLVDSVFQRDIPAVQGSILVIVLFFLVINTLVDIAYVLIDPRIRYT